MPDQPILPGEPADPGSIDPGSIDLLAAALRADAGDIDTLVRVLTATLGDTLPAGIVDVQRDRSVSDRLSGRDGTAVAVTISTTDTRLHLAHGSRRGGAVTANVQRIVRGVVISRRDVDVDEWLRSLAAVVADLATRNAAAREALGRLLGG
jgi:hypothetical protein